MTSFRARSQVRKAKRQAVNDALAAADQRAPSRLDRLDQERMDTEPWTADQEARLLRMIREQERKGPLAW